MLLKLVVGSLVFFSVGAVRAEESHSQDKTGPKSERPTETENPWNSEGYRALPGVKVAMNLDQDGWKALTGAGIDLPKACIQIVQHKGQPKDFAFILVSKKPCADEDVIMKEKDVAIRFPTSIRNFGEVSKGNSLASVLTSLLGVSNVRLGAIYHPDYDNQPIGYWLEEPEKTAGSPHRISLMALCTRRSLEAAINPLFDFTKICKNLTKKGQLVGIELSAKAQEELAAAEREAQRRQRQAEAQQRSNERNSSYTESETEPQTMTQSQPRQELGIVRDARTYREGWNKTWSLNPLRAAEGKKKMEEIERKWEGDYPGSYEAGRDAALYRLDVQEAWRYEQRRIRSEAFNQVINGVLGR